MNVLFHPEIDAAGMEAVARSLRCRIEWRGTRLVLSPIRKRPKPFRRQLGRMRTLIVVSACNEE